MGRPIKNYVIDSGVDWLTLTCKHDVSGYNECMDIWEFLTLCAANDGHEKRDCGLQGYRGVRAGSYFFGCRDDEAMFIASGAWANNAMDYLKGVKFRGNVTALHAQTTIRGAEAKAKNATQLQKHRVKCFTRGQTRMCRTYELIGKADGADTIYFGSAHSDSRLAIYNAAAKHPDRYSGDAIRYEARFKSRCTAQPWARLQAASSLTGCAHQIAVGKSQAIGITERWQKGTPPIQPMAGTVKTTLEGTLSCWEKQVLRKAVNLALAGHAEAVAEALGCVEYKVRPEHMPTNEAAEVHRRLSKEGMHSDTNGYA